VTVVAVLSLKGGVGKTTVALGLAGAALQRALPTLVVDLDPQANATSALRPDATAATIAEVLDDPRRSVRGSVMRFAGFPIRRPRPSPPSATGW
jgi:cellulose biosynthesis protein BcsQ